MYVYADPSGWVPIEADSQYTQQFRYFIATPSTVVHLIYINIIIIKSYSIIILYIK